MPQSMGRDVREGFILFVLLVVFLDKPLEHAFIAGRNFGIAALVEEQEIPVSVNADCRRPPSVLHGPPQCLVDPITHGDLPDTVLGFRCVHIVADLAIL